MTETTPINSVGVDEDPPAPRASEALKRFVREGLAALSAAPTPPVEQEDHRSEPNGLDARAAALEQVARIIGPNGWRVRDHQRARIEQLDMSDEDRRIAIAGANYYTRDSLEKARAILYAVALQTPAKSGSEQENLQTERERVRELEAAAKCALGYLTGNMDGDWTLGDPVEMLRRAPSEPVTKGEG